MRLAPAALLLLVAACAAAPEPPPVVVTVPPPTGPLPLLGGYRDPADACQRLGESPETSPFLDDAADLVGCPEGAENLGVFVTETGAREVTRMQGYVLYSVPLR